jgi:hypothetical protein
MNDLPQTVAELVDVLASMPGAIAVVLGGSRALGTSHPGGDWDLGLYYRGEIELSALAARGTVFPPGSWGRLMNGGAWLRCGAKREPGDLVQKCSVNPSCGPWTITS